MTQIRNEELREYRLSSAFCSWMVVFCSWMEAFCFWRFSTAVANLSQVLYG